MALREDCGHHGMLLCLLHCQLHGAELRQAQAAGEVLREQDGVKAGEGSCLTVNFRSLLVSPGFHSSFPHMCASSWLIPTIFLKQNINPHLVVFFSRYCSNLKLNLDFQLLVLEGFPRLAVSPVLLPPPPPPPPGRCLLWCVRVCEVFTFGALVVLAVRSVPDVVLSCYVYSTEEL